MKLNPRALAITAGIFWGAVVMLSTWWVMLFHTGGQTLKLLGNFYIGYSVSLPGSLLGLCWGFVDGLICAYIFGALYNLFDRPKAEPKPESPPV
jgi:hypothetical protein